MERQTYSMLEWLGDCGGLFDALRIIGMLIMWPLTSFKLKSELLSNVFRFTKSMRMAEKQANQSEIAQTINKFQSADCDPSEAPSSFTVDKSLKANMKWDFQNAAKIPAQRYLQTLLGCGQEEKYRRMLKRADSEVAKELDIVKYIQRSRLNSIMMLILLSSHQKLIADKMSTCLIRESSDLSENSKDEFELDKKYE